jgi:ethanolamine utilization cobalamin adenosyltransferase
VHIFEIEAAVELVVARDDRNMAVVLRSPVPERMLRVVLTQICDVTSQNENITRNLQRVLRHMTGVIRKLQMKVRSVLDL